MGRRRGDAGVKAREGDVNEIERKRGMMKEKKLILC